MNAYVSAAAVTADLSAPYSQFQIWNGEGGGRYVFSKAYGVAAEDFAGAVIIMTSRKTPGRLLWAGDGRAFMKLRQRDPELLDTVDVYVHWLTACAVSRRQMVLDLYSHAY